MSNYSVPSYAFQQQPHQYSQYPYDPRLEKLQALDSRMSEMEARLYENANNLWQRQENVNPQSYPNNGNSGKNQNNPQKSAFITVQSEEEAFRDPPNIDGSKQIYTDSKNGGLPTYAKWFDANIPKTFRKYAVWHDVGDAQPETESSSKTPDIAPAITTLSEKVAAMEESISSMIDEFEEVMTHIRKLTASAKRGNNGQFAKKEEINDGK